MAELEYGRVCLIYFALIPVAQTRFAQCLTASSEMRRTHILTSIIINDFPSQAAFGDIGAGEWCVGMCGQVLVW